MPDANYYIMQKYTRTGKQYEDGTLIDAVPISMEKPEFVFPGDTTNFLLHQDYVQYVDWYLEKVPSPGTPNSKYPDLFFVDDSPIQDLGGGVGQFTRTWAQLPGFGGQTVGSGSLFVRTEAGSFVWTRPGKATEDSIFMLWFIDQPDSVATLTATDITLYTTDNIAAGARWTHNVTAAYNTATIGYWVLDPISNMWKEFSYTTTILDRGTDWIKVAPVPYSDTGVTNPVLYVYFSRPKVDLEPEQKTIPSYLYLDYYLPGLNCTDVESIPIVQAWQILDENLNPTNTLTEATDPTLTEYNAMVTAGNLICIESSIVRRWRGNIWERATRYAKPI